jgi:hypothetical protein
MELNGQLYASAASPPGEVLKTCVIETKVISLLFIKLFAIFYSTTPGKTIMCISNSI